MRLPRARLILMAILVALLAWVWITDRPSPSSPHGQFVDTLFGLGLFWTLGIAVVFLIRIARAK